VRAAAQDVVAPEHQARADRPATQPVAKLATAARASSAEPQPPLPGVLTDNGIRKPVGMTSDLDELYRVGLVARATGSILNGQTASILPPNLRTAAENHTLALDDVGRVQVFVYTTTEPSSVAASLAARGMDVQRQRRAQDRARLDPHR
jgi:hypothetical protein